MKPRLLKGIVGTSLVLLIGIMYAVWTNSEIRFNRYQAVKDIMFGNVKEIFHGLGGSSVEINTISRKYGFEKYNLGCVGYGNKGEAEYREIIEKYLQDRNGKDWRSKYQVEVETLRRYQDSMYQLQNSSSK